MNISSILKNVFEKRNESQYINLFEKIINYSAIDHYIHHGDGLPGNFNEPKWLVFFICMTAVVVFGVVGNVATVVSIWRNHSLHTPTFTAIGCLTFTDIFAVTSRYVSFLTSFYVGPLENSWQFSLVYYSSLTLYICSTLHILLLTVMRFLLVVYPMKSLSLVTNRRIRSVSYLIWIFSFVVCVPYFLRMKDIYDTGNPDFLVEIAVSLTLAFTPSLVIITLHCMKVRAINGPMAELHPHQARHMTYLVGFILGFQVISTVPSLIMFICKSILYSTEVYNSYFGWLNDFGMFVTISMLMNHAADPIFYFALTPSAKRICKRNWKRTKSIYKRYSVSNEIATHLSVVTHV